MALLVPTLVYLPNFTAYTKLSTETFFLTFASTAILSLVIITAVAVRWKEWRSYAIAAVIGQAAGAGLLSVTVFAISPYFLCYFVVPIGSSLILPIFVWTFATELPFILLAGPPIIKACYRAFPSLRQRSQQKAKLLNNPRSQNSQAFAPAAISSFFEIHDTQNNKPIIDLEKIGAIGGGFGLKKGVYNKSDS